MRRYDGVYCDGSARRAGAGVGAGVRARGVADGRRILSLVHVQQPVGRPARVKCFHVYA